MAEVERSRHPCRVADARPPAPADVAGTALAAHLVRVATASGATVCERCQVADTVASRMRGLLGREELPAGEGVWIRPSNSIHMFFMRFAIDAVFLDRSGTVLRLAPGLEPWRMASCRRARSVLELAAGEIERRGLQVGDVLEEVALDAGGLAA